MQLIIYCHCNAKKRVAIFEAIAPARPSMCYDAMVKVCAVQVAAPVLGALLLLALRLPAATPYEFPVPTGPAPGLQKVQTDTLEKEDQQLDELVLARLRALNLTPAKPCSDAVFARRVWLDVTGTLPTAAEAQDFILNTQPGKRRALIERLLARDEYADYLALKWSDVLRIKAEFPINLWPNAAQSYHHWVREAVRTNAPLDQVARTLLTASGSDFENPPVNFYRAMQNKTPAGLAQAVALTFLGERADHWPSNRLANLAVFFANVDRKATAEWKEEILFFNPAATNAGALNGASRTAILPDGQTVKLSPDQDPRIVLAGWLVQDPQFARAMVNRAWYWLFGRGLVQEPDDFRADNPPVNPELLNFLATEFTDSGYDFKQLYRLILNSHTYQFAPVPADGNPAAAANFACHALRRLDAEVLIDAIDQLTGANESYVSAIPEPFTYIPDNLRSIALPDGSITSSFLELFGRPSRDTGLASERNDHISAAQKLNLLNSTLMQRKIEQSRMITFQTSAGRPPADAVTGMYLGILSRYPTSAESKTAEDYLQSSLGRRPATVDLAWALMNSAEFLYQH